MKALWGALCAMFIVAVAISFLTSNQRTETAAKIPGVAMPKELERSQLQRELETAITRAKRAVADAEEVVQEDEWGTSERRSVATAPHMPAETRPSAEASERQRHQTIREIHIAEAKAAKARLEHLKAQLANVH
jgi:hypothetical protein